MNYLDFFTKDETQELFKNFCEKMKVDPATFAEQFDPEQSIEKQAIAAKLILRNEVEPAVFSDIDFAGDIEEQIFNYLGTGRTNPSEPEVPTEKLFITDSELMQPKEPFN